MGTRLAIAFQRFDQVELRICRALNRPSDSPWPRAFFHCVSRLGDGWLWYALILAQPLILGTEGWSAALHLAATGAVGVTLYKLIKRHAVRERPFITHAGIHCAAAPLAIFAFLVAFSRVVLGLHYPTDVAAGALLGVGLALTSLRLVS